MTGSAKDNNRIWQVIDILKWGEDYFKNKGFESPKQEIEWLLCDLLEYKRIDLYINFENQIKKAQLNKLKSWIKRRVDREPLQYITGKTEFYGLKFKINKKVLIPRPETERLVEIALNSIKEIIEPEILEVGAGSGCISIAISSEEPKAKIVSLEVSKDAILLAEENANINNINNINFIEMDFLKDLPKGKFDVILSNPPYISELEISTLMPEVKNYEPKIALTDYGDGLIFYRRFADIAKFLLKPSGLIILEVGLGEHPTKVVNLFKESGYEKIELIKDFNNDQRILKIQIFNE